jgi:putative protease
MVEHLDDLAKAGVSSFKIEGRLKTIYYIASVVSVYRKAIDLMFEHPDEYEKQKTCLKTMADKIANRDFTTGFYYGKPNEDTNNYDASRPTSRWQYSGLVTKYNKRDGRVKITAKNRILPGAKGEILSPDGILPLTVEKIFINGQEVVAAHAGSEIEIPIAKPVLQNSFLRLEL